MLFPAKQRICPSVHPDLCLATIPSGGRSGGWDSSIWEERTPSGARVGTHRRRVLATQKGRWQETLPKAAPRLGLLHQAHAPQRARRVRGRAVRRHPQDGLRVASPRVRDGVRLPGPDRAARHRLGGRDLHKRHRPLQGLRAGPQARPVPPEAEHLRAIDVHKNPVAVVCGHGRPARRA